MARRKFLRVRGPKFRRRARPASPFTPKNPAYREWRQAVLTRCGNICQLCHNYQAKRLQCHHIKKKSTHPELAFDPNNGVCLCKRCHMKIVGKREHRFEHLFELSVLAGQPLPYSIFVWFNDLIMDKPPSYCLCGCGEPTRFYGGRYKMYLLGHFHQKSRKRTGVPEPGMP